MAGESPISVQLYDYAAVLGTHASASTKPLFPTFARPPACCARTAHALAEIRALESSCPAVLASYVVVLSLPTNPVTVSPATPTPPRRPPVLPLLPRPTHLLVQHTAAAGVLLVPGHPPPLRPPVLQAQVQLRGDGTQARSQAQAQRHVRSQQQGLGEHEAGHALGVAVPYRMGEQA